MTGVYYWAQKVSKTEGNKSNGKEGAQNLISTF